MTRVDPWEYDRELYKRGNDIERHFGRIKCFRRVFTRYTETDVMCSAFGTIAFIAEQLRSREHALARTGEKRP